MSSRERPLDLRDLHARVTSARRDVSSAFALTGTEGLAAPRLRAALAGLDALLRDLEAEGLPSA